MNSSDYIKFNGNIHNKIFDIYEQIHGEIFNPVEQERLHIKLAQATTFIKTSSSQKIALDYGCGTGNLTRHLLDLGLYVVSADIAENFLMHIKQRFANTGRSDILKINGEDLSNIEDNKFDLVATYSVLHHVPNYLEIIKEMVRVTKRGGIIYIDHEENEAYWNRDKIYIEFLQLVVPNKSKKTFGAYLNLQTCLKIPKYIMYRIRQKKNPRYTSEGDIHVWPDDHIEWSKIESVLLNQKCKIILKEDYLIYKRNYLKNVYENYKHKCSDYCIMIAMKT